MELLLQKEGFTLIELSIVLVIIGLIIGGILVGQDLIAAATIRAQVTQIEKYNTAVNTFRGKYNALPGDISATSATQFGFLQRALLNPPSVAGDGDGNGVIEGSPGCGFESARSETLLFWSDLGIAGLIDEQFPKISSDRNINTIEAGGPDGPVSSYLPQAKIGNSNYIYVWSGGYGGSFDGNDAAGGLGGGSDPSNCDNASSNGINYFALSQVPGGIQLGGWVYSNPGLSVNQAYAIDKKMDDGLPQSGSVMAWYPNPSAQAWILWAQGYDPNNGYLSAPSIGSNLSASGTNIFWCYDDSTNSTGSNPNANNSMHYSTEIQNGSNVNCALSFQFQ